MLPWISIETSPVGTVRPCCLAIDEITDNNGNKYNLREHTLEEIYHSEYMQNLRKEFLEGKKPETCKRCWKEEEAGRISKRINSKVRLKDYYYLVDWQNTNPDQLWFIDLKLGNICNLKCRICGSWSSSPWAQEELAYTPEVTKKEHVAYWHLKQGMWPRESDQFWTNLRDLLPNIKYFEFTGGEPFLIKEHFNLLQFAVDNGYSKDIEIHYNTNGTVYPDVSIWKHFKHVEVAFSIDNVAERFEYERHGAVWNEVQSNLLKFNRLRNTKFSTQLCLTVNIQNVYYLPEICDWITTQQFDSIYFNMLHDPWHMNIGRMTPAARQLVISRLTTHNFDSRYKLEIMRIVQFIRNGIGSDGHEFLRKMQQTDSFRGQDLRTTHKEIAEAMGYDN